MIEIDVSDITRLAEKTMPFVAKQIPFAAMLALNDVGFSVRRALRDEMSQSFDQPTPYILNSLWVKKATKDNLTFTIGPEEFGKSSLSPEQVLEPEIQGGGRPMKRSEARIGSYWVPGEGAKIDRFGNVPGSEISTILSALSITSDPMQWRANVKARGGKGKPNQREFFRQGNVIYERKGRDIIPYLVLTREPHYEKRLKWGDTAKQIVSAEFGPAFSNRLNFAIATAK